LKKNLIILICLFFLLWPLSFGCSKADVIRGIIVSVDTTKNEIVIKDKKTGAEKTIAVNLGDMASLKKDAAVKVTLEPGTNKAQSIKLHSQRSKDE
jgi:hypothetical protein